MRRVFIIVVLGFMLASCTITSMKPPTSTQRVRALPPEVKPPYRPTTAPTTTLPPTTTRPPTTTLPPTTQPPATNGTVYLTFDDGPNPGETQAILAILARYHVPATFFVVG